MAKQLMYSKIGIFKKVTLLMASVLFITSFLSGCSSPPSSQKKNEDTAQSNDTKKPNIIFILADDHRWDLIGKYHPIIKTPTLDSLANNGVVFKNAFVTTPICAASRASILTGLTERTHDYTFRQPPVPAAHAKLSYPQMLRENGYRSGFVGKFGAALEGKDSDRFDYFDSVKQKKEMQYEGKNIPQTYYMAESAIDFIEESTANHAGAPWSVSVSFWNPHAFDNDEFDQYHYPKEFDALYNDVVIPPAKLATQEYYNSLPEFFGTPQSIAKNRWKYRFGTEEIYQKMVKRHYRAISAVDRAVGMIRERLEELGQADNTVIIYTGDNGYAINDRLLAGKWFGWEEDLRVPLIIYDPRKKLNQTREIDELALNIDIPSTILDLAGVSVPKQYQGKSLEPVMQQPSTKLRDDFFFEHMFLSSSGRIPGTEGVRTQDWKYVRFYDNDNYEQLYNLKSDPIEAINLASDSQYKDKLNELRKRTDNYATYYASLRANGKRRSVDDK